MTKGKGKPLTARRITEVKNAIEAYANEAKASADAADQAIEKLFRSRVFFKGLPQNESDRLKRIVTDVFETCDSAMAREVLGEHIVAICLRGDDVIRSEEDIKAKADAIKANCREIQTAAKGNQIRPREFRGHHFGVHITGACIDLADISSVLVR